MNTRQEVEGKDGERMGVVRGGVGRGGEEGGEKRDRNT